MSSIGSLESELRNQLSSIPRLPLRWHPLSWCPKSKWDICPSPHDFYAFPSINFVFHGFRCLRGFSLTFFWGRFSRVRVHARLPWDFHFFAFTTFTRVLFQTRKIGLWKSTDTSARNLEIAPLFKEELDDLLKYVRKVFVTTWYKERYAEICEGCESKKA